MKMNKSVYAVLIAQFLSAFADNAVLFTAITLVLTQADSANWYIPALQASFLLAFVFLAPWVGRYADKQAKPTVLFRANLIKAGGAALLFFTIEPLIAFVIIGIGAALYSPAKYGILPELVDEKSLVKANGWIEGSTIIAILSGTVVGAALSEYSIDLALTLVVILYFISALVVLSIKHKVIAGNIEAPAVKSFLSQMKGLLAEPRARYSILGVSLFWASATVLRVLLIAWVPAVLFIYSTTDIALLTLFVAIGIAVGAMFVPKIIPMNCLRRARIAAYAMGIFIVLVATMDNIWIIRAGLFCIGICGGLFVVPINAALQEVGYKTIGSGRAVAIQNFFENLAMLIASGVYAAIAGFNVDPVITMAWLGGIVIVSTLIVSWRLPRDPR